ncbi:MAG TPA: glucosidase [Anaeromyxobacter sp.]|nr:glucosidase [Anaeromyxobacter sp.]
MIAATAEHERLAEAREKGVAWRRWGPYLSERQWGTVREDYSASGDAWSYFSHDQARSRAYRWGEDGLAGLSDDRQRLCFALALWNGADPILKERLFGLTNVEGNHGEDVKEYYFYVDSTPTHSYMRWLYKYPQRAYPYADLVETNRRRTRLDLEYELLDTGVFAGDRYFDVQVEYAKASPEDVLVRITITNRGPERARIDVLPTLWFRNTWSWGEGEARPSIRKASGSAGTALAASHAELGERWLHCDGAPKLLFTENETNAERVFGTANASPFVKDAFHALLVDGKADAVNPAQVGTKAAAHYRVEIAPGASEVLRLRLSDAALPDAFGTFDRAVEARLREADAFYAAIIPAAAGEDGARVARQAMAGMLWSKQYYLFDAERWLRERGVDPFDPNVPRPVRNRDWFHMRNEHVISMPDKWEYPWYAAWDLAFHTVVLADADPDFAKEQLDLMLREIYLHPSGQIPAYEWNFSDVNPPVHAWATIFQYRMEQAQRGKGDLAFLKRAFTKLLFNFTWWVNRKDRFGKNVFEGGFLGLDNIGVFDRSAPLPTGGHLEQADGTAWMAMYCQNMLEMAAELAADDPTYEDLAVKFMEHFVWIGAAMNRVGHDGMWDDEDGFYYDVLRRPDGSAERLKVRSLVGLLPLCATTVVEPWQRERMPRAAALIQDRVHRMPELLRGIHATGEGHRGYAGRGIFALVNRERLERILARMLDENEFLSPYGLRSVSRFHAEHPYVFRVGDDEFRVNYLPAESDTGMFGGNSNWRGPIWLPVNALIVRALLQFYLYYGDSLKVECPTGSGRRMNLFEVAKELSDRLVRIFLKDPGGRRPVYGGAEKFQLDPTWRDNLLFYEYFHGDVGAGVGASHQTGWTGLVATLIRLFAGTDGRALLEGGKRQAFER